MPAALPPAPPEPDGGSDELEVVFHGLQGMGSSTPPFRKCVLIGLDRGDPRAKEEGAVVEATVGLVEACCVGGAAAARRKTSERSGVGTEWTGSPLRLLASPVRILARSGLVVAWS